MSEETVVISKATYNEAIKTFSAIGWGGLRDRLVRDAEKARADGDGAGADRSAQDSGNHNSALSRRSERKIGDCGNYYGCLWVAEEDGEYFWSVENYDGFDWCLIPKYLYDALVKHDSERQGDCSSG